MLGGESITSGFNLGPTFSLRAAWLKKKTETRDMYWNSTWNWWNLRKIVEKTWEHCWCSGEVGRRDLEFIVHQEEPWQRLLRFTGDPTECLPGRFQTTCSFDLLGQIHNHGRLLAGDHLWPVVPAKRCPIHATQGAADPQGGMDASPWMTSMHRKFASTFDLEKIDRSPSHALRCASYSGAVLQANWKQWSMASRQLPVLKNQLMKSSMSMRDPKKSKKAKNTEVFRMRQVQLENPVSTDFKADH